MMKNANAISAALDHQYSTIAWCKTEAFEANRRAELLMRMLYNVPLHEWAQAKARGSNAVHLLLDAYKPDHARQLIADGHVPCCPPWASRRYREASMRAKLSGAATRVLYGTATIARHLGVTPRLVAQLHQQRRVPTYRCPLSKLLSVKISVLDEWAARPSSAALLISGNTEPFSGSACPSPANAAQSAS